MSKVDYNAPTLPSLSSPIPSSIPSSSPTSSRTPTLPSLTFADIKDAMAKQKAAEDREIVKQVIAASKAKRTYDFHIDVTRDARKRPIIKRED